MITDIPAAGLLQLITAAITPVAMISAAAIIIGGIGSKHQSLSDRVRSLTAEFRETATSEERRASIRQQMLWFERRINHVANASRLLYFAIAAFVFTVLLIILTPTG